VKQGNPPIPHRRASRRPNSADRRRVDGGGAARELALEVGVPIWGIGSEGAHRGGITAAKRVGGGELATAGWRRGGGHRLVGQRGVRCRREARGGGNGGSP
jgi:hypothetical protein